MLEDVLPGIRVELTELKFAVWDDDSKNNAKFKKQVADFSKQLPRGTPSFDAKEAMQVLGVMSKTVEGKSHVKRLLVFPLGFAAIAFMGALAASIGLLGISMFLLSIILVLWLALEFARYVFDIVTFDKRLKALTLFSFGFIYDLLILFLPD